MTTWKNYGRIQISSFPHFNKHEENDIKILNKTLQKDIYYEQRF